MYTQVTLSAFIDAFRTMDRMDNFSYEGLVALYDWFEQYEEDTVELDVIAICCDFTESTVSAIREDYNLELKDYPLAYDVYEYLQDNTIVIEVENGNYIYQAF